MKELVCSRQFPDAFRTDMGPQAFTTMGPERMPIDDEGKIYWHVHNWGQDIAPYHQMAIFSMGFNSWTQHMIPWQAIPTANPNKAEWHIYHAIKNVIHLPNGDKIDSPFDFIASPNTLAVQWPYWKGGKQSLWCVINDDHNWGLTHDNHRYNTHKMFTHENGHGWRIGHSDTKDDPIELMLPIYNPKARIGKDSLSAIDHLHGDHIGEYMHLPQVQKLFERQAKGLKHPSQKTGCLAKLAGWK